MRSTIIVSLVASCALLSQLPAACAAPLPSQVESVGERGWRRRQCSMGGCRITDVVSTSPYAWFYMLYSFTASHQTVTLRPNLRCKIWLTC
ncbi:hypothetical protein F5888DRAFT_1657628 [Russula emetica]|nr:hypothetical protein F5888DRAFT_1657628 [Russula emetica]